ncbi:hypothetical protein KDAU_48070 [Dictyobacter aurantiacus]|uniref:Uncharacterized protein n=1 Tax=Dictyobacter aurantiacus TaxID=1936993 RepID=A0A401ZKX7_9CHLR|nr:hypothetical protein KDAU_48070 [Dictyobacter aurantiacus]
MENLKLRSRNAYIFFFGALWGYTTFGHGSTIPAFNTGLLVLYAIMGLIGVYLVIFKDARIINRQLQRNVVLAEVCITLLVLAFIYMIPDSLGLVKAVIILIVIAVYFKLYNRTLDKLER